jgi:oligoendopeptidase F
MSIGQRILDGEPGIREKYLSFLSAGGSKSPRELLKLVDIDGTRKDMCRTSFAVVAGYVGGLERLSEER